MKLIPKILDVPSEEPIKRSCPLWLKEQQYTQDLSEGKESCFCKKKKRKKHEE